MRLSSLLMAACLVTGGLSQAEAQTPVAIVGVRLIDGNGGPPVDPATVVMIDGRISAAGAVASVVVPPGARVIRGTGMSLLPGLADMHTHLTGGWDGDAVDFLGFRRMLSSLLYSGVTTVLDPGDVLSWVKQLKTEVDAGRVAGPRIYYTGPVFDGPVPIWPDISASIAVDSQMAHFVPLVKGAGASFIKAYVGLADAQVAKLVEVARRASLRVIADVGGRNGSLGTAQTGIAAFAHAGTAPISAEAVKYMADHGTASLTTLAVYESFAHRRFQDMSFLDDPLLADVLPPSYRADLIAFPKRPMSAGDSAMVVRIGGGFRTAMANVKKMVDAGVMVVAGTDAPYPGDFYGEGLQRELELLVEAGLTPLQAIAAATRNAARLVGADSQWGTIEPGKVADLLLVRGDPSARIRDTRNIVSVFQAGRMVDRAGLKFDPRTEVDHRPSPLRPH